MNTFTKSCAASHLRERLAQPDALQLIDVREYPEYVAGRVAGSQLLPLSSLPDRASEIDPSQPVVLICRTGRRAAMAAQKLAASGCSRVEVLEGGTMAWEAAGFPLEKEPGAPWSLERQVRVIAGSLVLLGATLGAFWHPGFIGLAAFVGAGLIFAGVTDWCGMGLLLAKLPWNQSKPVCGSCPAPQHQTP